MTLEQSAPLRLFATQPRVGSGAPIHVLQITEDLGIGGLERVVATLAKGVDRARFRPSVLCLRAKGPFADELEALGITVHSLEYGSDRPDHLAFLHVRRIIREHRVDVLHTHNTNALVAGVLGRMLARHAAVVHTDHARAHPDKLRYYVAEHLASHVTHRMVGVSEETTDALHRFEWIPRRKLRTIENGIDEEPFREPVDIAAIRASLSVPADAPMIGMMARLSDQKGTTFLLNAVERLLPEFPDLVAVIAGDGERRSVLEDQAREAGINGSVRFLGMRLDGVALLRAFDILVLPSLWEGLPLVILEAMAAGTPIVASRVGGIPAVLTDGVSASLVVPGSAADLADAIRSLLRSSELRERYGRAARDIFTARYSATAMIRSYERLYMESVGAELGGATARGSERA